MSFFYIQGNTSLFTCVITIEFSGGVTRSLKSFVKSSYSQLLSY